MAVRHDCVRPWVAYRHVYYIAVITVSVFSCPWVSSSCVTSEWMIHGKVRNLHLKSRKQKKVVRSSTAGVTRETCHTSARDVTPLSTTEVAAAFTNFYFWLHFQATFVCKWKVLRSDRSRRECEPEMATSSLKIAAESEVKNLADVFYQELHHCVGRYVQFSCPV